MPNSALSGSGARSRNHASGKLTSAEAAVGARGGTTVPPSEVVRTADTKRDRVSFDPDGNHERNCENHMSKPPSTCSEPRAISRFLDSGHPWMALAVAILWLAPASFASLIGAALLLRHLL